MGRIPLATGLTSLTTRIGLGALALIAALEGCVDSQAAEAVDQPATIGARQPVPVEALESAVLQRFDDAERIPAAVEALLERIDAEAIAKWTKTDAQTGSALRPKAQLLRCNVPLRPRPRGEVASLVQLYVAREPHPHYAPRVLFLHDPTTGAITPKPLRLEARFIGDRGTEPKVADLNLDGNYELVFRDFAHNGTTDNRELAIYAQIGADLSLTEVLRHDTTTSDVYSELEWGVIRRRLMRPDRRLGDEGLGDGGLDALVIESWRENPKFHSRVEPLPDLMVRRDPASGVWQLLGELPISSPR